MGLLSGRTIVLEGVGRLSVGIKTKCFPQEVINDEEFSPSAMIKGVHINFRPDVNILKELRMKKTFRRISSEAMEYGVIREQKKKVQHGVAPSFLYLLSDPRYHIFLE